MMLHVHEGVKWDPQYLVLHDIFMYPKTLFEYPI